MFKIGEQKIERILKETTAQGFSKFERERFEDGTLGRTIYSFTDVPGVFEDSDHTVKTAPVDVHHTLKNQGVDKPRLGISRSIKETPAEMIKEEKNTDFYAENGNRRPSKRYTGVPTMGDAEEDFRDFAMSMKALDGSRLLAGGVLFSSTDKDGYPKLGELMSRYGEPVFEEAVRTVIARELLGGRMRKGGIRSWSYFEGVAKDITKKRAMGGMPFVEECPY